MGVHKGQNNFKEFQQGRVKSGKQRVAESLSKIKKGMVLETVSALVVYVACETRMNRTTILRNHKYADMVRQAFYAQPGITRFLKSKDTTIEIEQGKNFALEIKLKNRETELNKLKEQNRRLTKIIENIAQPTSLISSSQKVSALTIGEADQTISMPPADTAFVDTAQALLDLIGLMEKKDLGIVLDHQKKQIVDITEIGEKSIVVSGDRCRHFFHWLNAKSKVRALLSEKSASG